jgi:hypothetical protein
MEITNTDQNTWAVGGRQPAAAAAAAKIAGLLLRAGAAAACVNQRRPNWAVVETNTPAGQPVHRPIDSRESISRCTADAAQTPLSRTAARVCCCAHTHVGTTRPPFPQNRFRDLQTPEIA